MAGCVSLSMGFPFLDSLLILNSAWNQITQILGTTELRTQLEPCSGSVRSCSEVCGSPVWHLQALEWPPDVLKGHFWFSAKNQKCPFRTSRGHSEASKGHAWPLLALEEPLEATRVQLQSPLEASGCRIWLSLGPGDHIQPNPRIQNLQISRLNL